MISSILSVAAYLSLLPTLRAQSSYSCIDPNLPYSEVYRGQNTTICLYAGPSGNWNSDISYKRFAVNLVADEFSSYTIPGCELQQRLVDITFCSVNIGCLPQRSFCVYVAQHNVRGTVSTPPKDI